MEVLIIEAEVGKRQINGLYDDRDPRKASAYNIYYVGVNIGGFLAPFACGTVGELFGCERARRRAPLDCERIERRLRSVPMLC